MNKKKVSALFATAALAVSMLAGCGGSASASGAEKTADGKTVLSFYIWSDEESYIRKVVDAYNASQDKTEVELTVVAADDYDDKLKVLLSGGGDVDLVDIKGMSQVSTYGNAEALADLTDLISNSDLDVSNYGPMWDTSTVDNKYFALPTRTTCWVLYYNKDILDKAKIPYPSEQLTWDEYSALCDQVYTTCQSENIKAEDGADIKGGMFVDWVLDYYTIQNGVYLNSDDTDTIKDGLQLNHDLYNQESCYSYQQVTATDFDYLSEFENGHVALMPNGEWMVNMFKDDIASGATNVNWGCTYLPIPEGVEEHTTFGDFQFAGISAKSKHQEESFDFLKYLCGEPGATEYADNGIIAAYSSEEVTEAYKAASNNDTVSVFFDSNKIQQSPNAENYEEITKAYTENAQLYFLGETDLDTCMTNFTDQRSSILGK